MRQFPVFINLRGRTVVLVGEGEAAAAKARLIERAGGRIVPALEQGATIAFVALDDEAAARAAAIELRTHGLLVNVVDRPDLCDFTTPAIVDRAPVTIAIGTGGASAGLAKAVRQRVEALFPARLGALAAALHTARDAMKARWPARRSRGGQGRSLAGQRHGNPAIAVGNDPPDQPRPRRPHPPRRAPAGRGRSYLPPGRHAPRHPDPRPRRCGPACGRCTAARCASGFVAVAGNAGEVQWRLVTDCERF